MKRHGFWETFDSFFSGGPFDVLFDILLVVNCLLLLLVIYGGWPTPYTGPKKSESKLAFERHNDRLIDEFVRPKIEAKYNVKTLRAKTNADGHCVNILIETDGTDRYEEIAEDILQLAPVNMVRINVAWSRKPDIGDDGEPEDPPLDGEKRNQMRYILEFDHGSDDGGVTVFFANGMRYPGPTSSTPPGSARRQENSAQWHSNDYYNFH